jgi:hypothetical protein
MPQPTVAPEAPGVELAFRCDGGCVVVTALDVGNRGQAYRVRASHAHKVSPCPWVEEGGVGV